MASRSRILRQYCVLMAVALLDSAGAAQAGAWAQRKGATQVIATSQFSDSTRAFDLNGRLVPVVAWRKFELGVHIEYGLSPTVTLLASPVLEDVSIKGFAPGAYRGLESLEVGARIEMARLGEVVFAAQALGKIPGATNRSNTALAGATACEAEARLLAGYSFTLWDRPAFADGEIAWRARNGGNPGEARLELTIGVHLTEQAQLLMQSFNAATTGRGSPSYPDERWSKLQPSLVYEIARGLSLQAGAFITLAAVNARREQGALLAVWKTF